MIEVEREREGFPRKINDTRNKQCINKPREPNHNLIKLRRGKGIANRREGEGHNSAILVQTNNYDEISHFCKQANKFSIPPTRPHFRENRARPPSPFPFTFWNLPPVVLSCFSLLPNVISPTSSNPFPPFFFFFTKSCNISN